MQAGRIKFHILILLILIFTVIFSSCNIIFGAMHGRENPLDEYAQIAHFTAAPSSSNSIMTGWEWRAPLSWMDSKEIIETVKVVHSSITWPDINLFGETFAFTDPRSFEWTSLSDGTHYFALYYKEAGFFGQWFAPLYAKVTLPGVSESGVIFSREESLNIDNTPITPLPPITEWFKDGDFNLEVNSSKWAVVFFDIPDGVFITNASITLNNTGGAITEITFAPLTDSLPYDDKEKWNNLFDDSIVDSLNTVTHTGPGPYNITNTVRSSALTSVKAILIKTTDASAPVFDNNASPPSITADILR